MVFFILAPSFAVALMIRFVRRIIREPRRRWALVAVGTGALGIWYGASSAMLFLVFGQAYSLAHRRPFPSGPFPESWPIYAFLAAYAVLGWGLLAGASRVPTPPR
ncbi:MAG TPA: hypothetical protein VJY35_03795 [Candidatus Eisenbacteria bacterium]|nr:hypothetical protein [Candidatus Eisenbacteria bacterium]